MPRLAVIAAFLAVPLVAGTLAPSAALGSGIRPATGVSTATGIAGLTEIGAPFATAPFNGVLLGSSVGDVWSSPAVGDVTGDDIPEIIVGGLNTQARVYTTSPTGNRLIAILDPGGGDLRTGVGATHASPSLGDLNGDGVNDVVIANTGAVLAGYSLVNGVHQLFRHVEGARVLPGPNGLFGTPALGYVNDDAGLDVVASSWGQTVTAVNGGGAVLPGWPQWLFDTVWSSPAIGDIDGDGTNEIVVGGDCAGGGVLQPCYGTAGGGYVWAFTLSGALKWRHFVPGQVLWSTPALTDLNGDGALDVVIGTGAYWPEPAGRQVTALNGRTGSPLWTAPTPARVVGSPSIADVTGDGAGEVFVISRGAHFMSFDGATGAKRWDRCIDDSATCGYADSANHGGVALGDIDGDGSIEAVVQGEQQLRVFDATTGTLKKTVRSSYPRTIFASSSTPTIATVRGTTWIIQTAHGDANNNLQRDAGDELVVSVWTTGVAPGALPWPTFKANMARTSADPPAAPDVAKLTRFVDRVYPDFLDRPPTATERRDQVAGLAQGRKTRYDVTTDLSRTDEWLSVVITRFYTDTLGRQPDQGGLNGWITAARNGMPIAQIAAGFYASPEYFSTTGKSNYRVWMTDLYRKLLQREPDPPGLNGWVRALESGMPRDQVSFGFYQSPESIAVRIDNLYRKFLGRPAEPGGIASWSPFVRDAGDLALAAALASSLEYYNR